MSLRYFGVMPDVTHLCIKSHYTIVLCRQKLRGYIGLGLSVGRCFCISMRLIRKQIRIC